MQTTTSVVKLLATGIILPGAIVTSMGLGLVPIDDHLAKIAAPFLTPFRIPLGPFMCVLGSCQILGGLSLWAIGPMPEWFARIGLIFASICGGYGHYTLGDSVIGSVVYFVIICSLYVLDPLTKVKKE